MGHPTPDNRFGPLLVATCTLVLAAAGVLNYIVNPYLLYSTRLFAPLVQTPREDKYELLLTRPAPPDLVIMGSSRAERISPALARNLTGLDTFNAAVSRSTPVDFLVWTRFMLTGLKHPPRLLIISLDPEAFNPAQAWLTSAWLANSPLAVYAEDITQSSSSDPTEDTLRKLFSWQQVLDSLAVLRLDLTQSRPARLVAYDSDGGYTLADPGADTRTTVPDTGYLIPFYQNYPALSQEMLEHFERFLRLCQQENIALIVYLPPYHDRLLARLRAETDFLARHGELLAALEHLQGMYSFALYDLVEVSSFGGAPETFFNGDHMDVDNSSRLLEYILAEREPGT